MKRNLIIVGIIVVLIAAGAVFGWQRMNTASAANNARVQTTTVTRGTITATVSAAGNVSTIKGTSLTFQTSGRVAQVNVQVGDPVKAGQLLMQLDLTDLQIALKTAQVNLASSQTNLEVTKSNLQYALRNAQADLVVSKASLDAAVAKNAQNPNQLIIAKASLDKATVALQQAQSAYNAIAWRGDVGMTTQAANLQNATIEYQTALANYKITEASINDASLKSAQTAHEKDKVALEQAQRNLDTSLRTAQATVDKDQAALEQAQRNIEKAKIIAPYDGYVSAVNLNAGDSAGTSTAAIVMADLNALQVKVTVAEVDVTKIKVGQTAQMTLDALPGKTYTAQVTTMSPVGTITQGVVNYPVTLGVTNTDGAIKPGMTANLAIAVERRENVLLVPTRAVRTQGNQKTVTVLYKGQSIPVPVTVGLSGDQSIEIVSGLREGDEVVISQTTTRQTGGFGMPGGVMMIR